MNVGPPGAEHAMPGHAPREAIKRPAILANGGETPWSIEGAVAAGCAEPFTPDTSDERVRP